MRNPYDYTVTSAPPLDDTDNYWAAGGGIGSRRIDAREKARVHALEQRLAAIREAEAADAVQNAERFKPRQIRPANLMGP
jgi:hypothetical protein